MNKLILYKGRTNHILFNLGMDVSGDILTSEIRSEPDQDAPLIATFVVTKPNGGNDGLVKCTLDYSVLATIRDLVGYTDIKRMSGGEPLPVFPPIEVSFQGTVTV